MLRADRLRRARGVQPDDRPHLPDALHERLATRLHRRQRRVCLFLRPRGRDELRHDLVCGGDLPRRAEHNLGFRSRTCAPSTNSSGPGWINVYSPATGRTCTTCTAPPRRTSAPAATTPPSTSRSHGRGLAAAPTGLINASSMTAGREARRRRTRDATSVGTSDLRWSLLTATRLRRAGSVREACGTPFLVGRKPLETGRWQPAVTRRPANGRSSPVRGLAAQAGGNRAATSRAG